MVSLVAQLTRSDSKRALRLEDVQAFGHRGSALQVLVHLLHARIDTPMPLAEVGLLRQVLALISNIPGALLGPYDGQQSLFLLRLEQLERGWIGGGAEELGYLAVVPDRLLVLAIPLLLYRVSCRLVWVLVALEALLVRPLHASARVECV